MIFRFVRCLCCGREFRMSSGDESRLAAHVAAFHTESGINMRTILAWMIEDGDFQVVEDRAA